MSPMTDAQERVYEAIRDFRRDRGYPPTRAEIATMLGFKSANAAECHLQAIERKGWIRIHRGNARGLELV